MGRRFWLVVLTIAGVSLLGGGAFAASRYVITSTRQIKPSVLKQFQQRLATFSAAGTSATMCASGSTPTGQCEIASSDARCPGGTSVMSGGIDGGSNPPVDATAGYNEPDGDGRGWHVIMANNATVSGSFKTVVVCLGSVGRFARDVSGATPASIRAEIAQEAARLRSQER